MIRGHKTRCIYEVFERIGAWREMKGMVVVGSKGTFSLRAVVTLRITDNVIRRLMAER